MIDKSVTSTAAREATLFGTGLGISSKPVQQAPEVIGLKGGVQVAITVGFNKLAMEGDSGYKNHWKANSDLLQNHSILAFDVSIHLIINHTFSEAKYDGKLTEHNLGAYH